ncbi:hypothetical protein L873DRAFT_1835919 [Choiromyces venosus 120613-1]|uniref:F-box domain-containing protein n=1 Tax=Choiromyces venosus 120613-1 TaxID=1336337 RepID=A0A3N4JXP7_9PEZI|nr:hypothetical protein L873DRAFT_1835919 [Choiromyces venosus 120613-1]
MNVSTSSPINSQAAINLFANLSPSSRKEFLSELSKKFYPSDWNHIHTLLEQRSFFMDILGTLSIELAFLVIQHLDPIDTIRLRRVSKHYHEIFTSEDVCRFMSYNLLPTEDDSARPDSWRIYYENRVSRRWAFMNGESHNIEELVDSTTMNMTSFCHKTSQFAYVFENFTKFLVVDLSTSPITEVLPPMFSTNRSRILLIQLLPTHVVVATSMGVCYAWNLSTMEWHSFKLPNARVNSIHGDGNLVAISVLKILVVHDVVKETSKTYEGEPIEWLWNIAGSDVRIHRLLVDAERKRIWTLTESMPLEKRAVHMLDLLTGATTLKEMALKPQPGGRLYNWELRYALPLYCGNDCYDFVFDYEVYHKSSCSEKAPRAGRLVFDLRTGDCYEDTFYLEACGKQIPTDQFAHEYNGLTCCYNHHFAPQEEVSGRGFHPSSFFFVPGMAYRTPGKKEARFRFLDKPNFRKMREGQDRAPWLCNAMTEKFVLLVSHWDSELPVLVRFKGIHE